jgi:hypothetical protein
MDDAGAAGHATMSVTEVRRFLLFACPFAVAVLTTACGRIGFDATVDGDGGAAIPAVVPSWTSGTRLRARIADFGGAARVQIGWYDQVLDNDCVPIDNVAADGSWRCHPEAIGIVFTDAACTSALAQWTDNGSGPRRNWARLLEGTNPRRYFPVGAEVASPASYYTRGDQGCNGPFPSTTQMTYFSAGAEASPTTFVRLAPVRVGTGRIQAEGWRSEDGAEQLLYLFDTQLGQTCALHETDDGMRCVPSGAGTAANTFADPACTVPLVRGSTYDYLRIGEVCTPQRTHVRGPAWTGDTYAQMNGMCVLAGADANIYEVGPELPPAQLVSFTARSAQTGGRVDEVGWLGLDGARVRTGWRDTVRGDLCDVSILRSTLAGLCLPSQGIVTLGSFMDSACQRPIAAIVNACPFDYVYSLDTRGLTVHARDVDTPQPTSRYVYAFSCNASTLDPTPTYAVGGPSIPMDVFPMGTLLVE